MEVTCSNTRSTTRTTKKKDDNTNKSKSSTKDEDDGSVLKLELQCTQLELTKGHYIDFGIIKLKNDNLKLKGL